MGYFRQFLTESNKIFSGDKIEVFSSPHDKKKFNVYTDEGHKIHVDASKFGWVFSYDGSTSAIANTDVEDLIKLYPELVDAFNKYAQKSSMLYLPLMKDPTDDLLIKTIRQNGLAELKMYVNRTQKALPEKVQDELLNNNIYEYVIKHMQVAFDKDHMIRAFKSRADMFGVWLKSQKPTDVSQDFINEVVSDMINSHYAFADDSVLHAMSDPNHRDMLDKIPTDQKVTLIKKEQKLLSFFTLPDDELIKLVAERPDRLNNIPNPSGKVQQAAQWAKMKEKDRYKR